jgi:2Fe-2S ferredoxin
MTTLTILPRQDRRSRHHRRHQPAAGHPRHAGGKLVSKCGGEAKCGACHIFVTEGGRKGVSKMTPAENAKLDTIIGVSGKSRLACQATLLGTEPVTVELLGAPCRADPRPRSRATACVRPE